MESNVFRGATGAEIIIVQNGRTFAARGRVDGSDVVHLLGEWKIAEPRPADAWRKDVFRRLWKEQRDEFGELLKIVGDWLIERGLLR